MQPLCLDCSVWIRTKWHLILMWSLTNQDQKRMKERADGVWLIIIYFKHVIYYYFALELTLFLHWHSVLYFKHLINLNNVFLQKKIKINKVPFTTKLEVLKYMISSYLIRDEYEIENLSLHPLSSWKHN